jgi:RNA polymerase sigma-70 factor (ECF subfamily)
VTERLFGYTHEQAVSRIARIGAASSSPALAPRADFAQVFDEHLDRVWRALHAMGVPAHQVEDAAQEVFLIVHDKLDTFEGRSKLSTWIYAITFRVGSNYRSKQRRRPHHCGLDSSEPSPDDSPEQQVSQREATRVVEEYCRTLDEGMRDVFVLCLLEEQPAVDVAELLGLSPNTVYSRIRLLRQGLRSWLERADEEGER